MKIPIVSVSQPSRGVVKPRIVLVFDNLGSRITRKIGVYFL